MNKLNLFILYLFILKFLRVWKDGKKLIGQTPDVRTVTLECAFVIKQSLETTAVRGPQVIAGVK